MTDVTSARWATWNRTGDDKLYDGKDKGASGGDDDGDGVGDATANGTDVFDAAAHWFAGGSGMQTRRTAMACNCRVWDAAWLMCRKSRALLLRMIISRLRAASCATAAAWCTGRGCRASTRNECKMDVVVIALPKFRETAATERPQSAASSASTSSAAAKASRYSKTFTFSED